MTALKPRLCPTLALRRGVANVRRGPRFARPLTNERHDLLRLLINENDQADRAISTGKLHTLLRFHTRPIDVVVFHGSDREYWF